MNQIHATQTWREGYEKGQQQEPVKILLKIISRKFLSTSNFLPIYTFLIKLKNILKFEKIALQSIKNLKKFFPRFSHSYTHQRPEKLFLAV